MVVIAYRYAAGREQRVRFIEIRQHFPELFFIVKRIFRCPRYEHVFDPQRVDVGKVLLHFLHAAVHGDGRERVFFRQFAHLFGRIPVKAGKFHAVVTGGGNDFKRRLAAFLFRRFPERIQLNRKFLLFDRILNINLDYYRTNFTDQVVADNETQVGKVNFYNLDGDSYSNCYQVEVKYELIPRFDVLGAYRYNDVKTTMGGRLLRAPLQSKYKGLLNLSYYTNMKKWQFDFTTQFNGPGRIPVPVSENSGQADRFDSFRIMNAQISKFFRKWSIYAGCENIGDFTQKHPILAADRPWSDAFDSSKIWGPVHGRKFYLGLRFGLDRE